jgi:hypothetical protein
MKTFYSEYFNKLNKTLTCFDESKINQLFIWLLDEVDPKSRTVFLMS